MIPNKPQGVIEGFLQNKLSTLLDSFIEFQKLMVSNNEGMTIHNSTIKPRLVQELSQVLELPLEHISGSIQLLTLNIPWQKLFLRVNTPIKIQIQGLKLKGRLKTGLNEEFLLKKKEQTINRLTEKLFNPLDTSRNTSSFINKTLKEYFLNMIIFQVKNVSISIEIQLKNKVELILKMKNCVFRKQDKKKNEGEKIHLNLQSVGMYYNTGDNKEVELISPANINFERITTQGGEQNRKVSLKNFNIDKFHFHLNNYNYGDIAKVILLIQWHKSFLNLPYDSWKFKPSILKQCKPFAKFVYCAKLVLENVKNNKLRIQMALRRLYISLYTKLLTQKVAFSQQNKKQMEQMQKRMPIWKVLAYRSFVINLTKFKIQNKQAQLLANSSTEKKPESSENQNITSMMNMINNFWYKSWFSPQKNAKELQAQFLKKITEIQSAPSEVQSILNVKVQTITASISIIASYGTLPFISLIGYHCQYNKKELLIENKWVKSIQFRKCKIQFQKYLGHHERYKNFLCQSKDKFGQSRVIDNQAEEQDEFEDINYFVQIQFTNESKKIQIKLLPFDLFVNHQIIEKFNILLNIQNLSKLPKMHNIQLVYSHCDPFVIIQSQRQQLILNKKRGSQKQQINSPLKNLSKQNDFAKIYLQNKNNKKKIQNSIEYCLKSAANIIIPVNLRAYPQTQLILQIGEFECLVKKGQKQIMLKNLILKGNFASKIIEPQIVYSKYIKPQIESIIMVRKFDLKILLKNHTGFDELFVDAGFIIVDLPPISHIQKCIQLYFLLIPQQKQQRVKLYNRRKQSIGEEFMDACQNLNQHITKSIMLSSQKLSSYVIVKQKKTKHTFLNFQGFSISENSLSIIIKKIQLTIFEVGFDEKKIISNNLKEIKIIIKKLNQIIKNINAIKLHMKKQSIKKGTIQKNQDSQVKLKNIQFSNMNIYVALQLNKVKGQELTFLYLQISNLKLQENQENRFRKLHMNMKLNYQQLIPNKKPFKKKIKTPLIQQFKIENEETYKYNLFQRTVSINNLAINLKPYVFKILSLFIKQYYIEDEAKNLLTNRVINTINIKVPPKNFYLQHKQNQKCIIQNHFSEITLFNRKIVLEFNQNISNQIPIRKTQSIQISKNVYLINKQVAPHQYQIQSNIKIINHQTKTLWLKIYENSTFQFDQAEQKKSKLKNLSQKSNQPINLFKTVNQNQFKSSELKRSSIFQSKSSEKQHKGKYMTIPLKPKETVNLLVDSDQHKYFQIVDQGKIYTELNFSEMFDLTETTQIVVQSGQDQGQQSQYLIIKTQISSQIGNEVKFFSFHIFSPILIINKTPWDLQYRLSKEQGIEKFQNDDKKIGRRRRSFQIFPMKKIETLSSQKIRNFHYNQIKLMKISIKKYERQFTTFGNMIEKILQKHKNIQKQTVKSTQLMTVRNNKRELQMILQLELTQNTIKMIIFPQFIFFNLTKQHIQFKVKEAQVTYHLLSLVPGKYEQEPRTNNKIKYSQLSEQDQFINKVINLENQKFQQREVLKQVFARFENQLQVFTGNLSSQITKTMYYTSGKEIIRKQKNFIKSTRQYLSDYVSQSQILQHRKLKKQCILASENSFKYGPEEHQIFKRHIVINKYFNLIFFVPTVHIINKSQAIFYAKSHSQKLVKIPKDNHNFILVSSPYIDIQACFQDDEQISLTDWIQVNLLELKAIYYSKDMIQHSGSGYQSKQYVFRKKRMKKVPKIFYKVIICKYERGQKILIQQSQYPPISFINNTKHRIKISQSEQRFVEQLVNKGDMGEYTPKNPYHTPFFKLSVAQDYQYKVLKEFNVLQKFSANLDYGITLSVEEYKDKVIINITDSKENRGNVNPQKYLLNQLEDKNDFLLQVVKKNILNIKQLTFSIFNNWNKELNATFIEEVTFTHQNKNYKDYYKLFIKNIQGYDYMNLQPEYILHQKKRDKKRFTLNPKQQKIEKYFLSFQAIINFHKNALVLQKCDCILAETVFYVSADLLLAYVKNYEEAISNFYANTQYYKSKRSQQKKPELMVKKFIVESLNWHSTSLTFKTRNLSVLQTFLNKNYQKLIVRFLNWLGDIKPLRFQTLQINHQQISLNSLLYQIDFRKKMHQFGTILMDYPLSQLKQLLLLFVGDQEKTIKDKLNVVYKIFKSFEYVVSWTINLNQNLKIKTKTYNQNFIDNNKDDNNIISKIKKYEFCQWKYKLQYPKNKIYKKIKRFQRYNTRQEILIYDQTKSKVKLALDSFLKSKVFRSIENVYRLNEENILATVLQWIIVILQKKQWLVIRLQHLLKCQLVGRQLILHYWEQEDSQSDFDGPDRNKLQNVKQTRIKKIDLSEFNEQTLLLFKNIIKENILSYYY